MIQSSVAASIGKDEESMLQEQDALMRTQTLQYIEKSFRAAGYDGLRLVMEQNKEHRTLIHVYLDGVRGDQNSVVDVTGDSALCMIFDIHRVLQKVFF